MTKFLDSLKELVDPEENSYYVDPEGQHYRMVEEDEGFNFIDPENPDTAYIWVNRNNNAN